MSRNGTLVENLHKLCISVGFIIFLFVYLNTQIAQIHCNIKQHTWNANFKIHTHNRNIKSDREMKCFYHLHWERWVLHTRQFPLMLYLWTITSIARTIAAIASWHIRSNISGIIIWCMVTASMLSESESKFAS